MTGSTEARAADDVRWMRRAIELAESGRGLTSPNPMVGAVVVKDGRSLGEGFHARAGGLHAEAEALQRAGAAAHGATVYVTLEPCNHRGRTPPCVEAVLAAGVARVVAAIADPNPRVTGGGARALRAAGVDVTMGCLGAEVARQNRTFFTAMRRGRPHVTLKCAMTLDGKIAAFDGSARWITGEDARRLGHRLRSEVDAVVVGIGTALADNPSLDVRLGDPWPREPFRLVVDSAARLPVTARLIATGRPVRAAVAVTDRAPAERVAALEARGVTVLRCKERQERVDLEDLCAHLFALDVIGVLLEGGGELNASFLEAGLVDRVAVFIAPLLLGGATAPTAVGGAGRLLPHAIALEDMDVRRVGRDWLIEADIRHAQRGD
ncbi:MAG TPA: bifunctional diaminohydroxyphosphoribosylaminopyrimidine deaminase/5-amino-6-(5-phosphoribosylamino)uracil reductase RibD [Candidatus Limnocylindrales bacterium]|nr:bifunctional diaminohydroxyphosphoribosylaminopyrimidine deaminase/5-amino-6-(5-phosphoribosylamino)uracil reductase RibD [Candidatus Limnocylindrales bacterium]